MEKDGTRLGKFAALEDCANAAAWTPNWQTGGPVGTGRSHSPHIGYQVNTVAYKAEKPC
jgi:hypothetical protein